MPPTLFSPGVAAPLQNIVLRAQTHIGWPALGGFVINAADHIKAAVSLASGWPAEQVAEVLLIDSNTVRDHFLRYQWALIITLPTRVMPPPASEQAN